MSSGHTPIRRKLMTMILLTSGAVLLLTSASFVAHEFLTFHYSTVRNLSTLGQVIATNRPEPWRGIRVDYTSILANTTFGPNLEEALAKRGVLVTEVETGSDADRAGLKAGQIISRVGDKAVPNPREFLKAVEGLKGPVQIETEQGPMTIK